MLNFRRGLLLSTIVGAFIPAAAFAQAAPAQDQGGIETVTVTAQKRTENIQSVPLSVDAVSGEQLGAFGATDTRDLSAVVPGLVFSQGLTAAKPFIRGIGQTAGSIGVESPVSTYIDGIYLVQPASSIFELADVSRVEVLKGPQGTLFGRNSVGGVLNVVTRDPMDTPHLDATLGYGNYNTISGNAYATDSIADNLDVSFSAYGTDRMDGYGHRVAPYNAVYTGGKFVYTYSPVDQKIFQESQYALHSKIRWKPMETMTVEASVMYTYHHGYIGTAYGIAPGYLASDKSTTFISPYTVTDHIDPYNEDKQLLGSLKVTKDFEWGSVTSLTGYHTLEDTFYANSNPNNVSPTVAFIPGSGSTFTQEVQVAAPADQDLQWIAGLYYLSDLTKIHSIISLGQAPLTQDAGGRQTTASYAAFAQATKTIFPDTRLTAGLRYTADRKSLTGQVVNGAGVVTSTPENPGTINTGTGPVVLPPLKTPKGWGNVSYHIAVDHSFTEDLMGYVSYTTGFNSGLYNVTNFQNPPAAPETIGAFEAGVKSEWLAKRLLVNLAVFDYDYSNLQLKTILAQFPGLFFTVNAASSRMKGVDAHVEAQIIDHLTLNAGASYLDAHYSSFPAGQYNHPNPTTSSNIPSNCVAPATLPASAATPGGATSLTCNLSGFTMARAPKWVVTVGGTYAVDLDEGASLLFNVNDQYNSGFAFDVDNILKQSPYHNINASVTWTSPSGQWDVSVWGKNLGDAVIWSDAQGGASFTYNPGLPRTFGIKVGTHL